MSGIKVVFGTASALWSSDKTGPLVLDILEEAGVYNLDSARIYGDSEEVIGKRGVAKKFTVDTKHPGGLISEGAAAKEKILESANLSFKLLQTDQVWAAILTTFYTQTN